MNVLELIGNTGTTIERVAGTHGGEYAGPCPMCGGRDRFRVWPERGDGGRWWCRGCGKGGDGIQFLRDARGLGFLEACDLLGVERGNIERAGQNKGTPTGDHWIPRKAAFPCEKWQGRAGSFVAWAEGNLSRERDVLRWLEEERGLKGETVKATRIGWNSGGSYHRRETWGLPKELNEKGRVKKLWLPAGLVIPFLHEGGVTRLKVRRLGKSEPRYVHVAGGSMATMTLDGPDSCLVVVESELDGLLLWQEAGDMTGVVILGSAQARPDAKTTARLKAAEVVLVALDADGAGAKQAWGFWNRHFPKAGRWPPIRGKDITDSWRAGVPLRTWLEVGLDVTR